eukprot:1158859-Pelagomonas_calceolata.AAC.4
MTLTPILAPPPAQGPAPPLPPLPIALNGSTHLSSPRKARPSSGVLVEGGPGTERSSGALSNGRTDSRKVQQQQQQQQHLGSSGDAPLGPGDDLPQKGVDAGALGGEVAVSGSTAQNLRKGNSKGDRSIKEVGGDQAAGEPGKDSERRGTGAGRGGAGLGYGSLLLHNGEAASEVFGGARTLRAGTAEPVLDESFYKWGSWLCAVVKILFLDGERYELAAMEAAASAVAAAVRKAALAAVGRSAVMKCQEKKGGGWLEAGGWWA